jgi:hypothetical protein
MRISFLREPLLHFAVLGAGLFGLYWLVDGDAAAPAGEIIVTGGRIHNLAETFNRTWQRPPSEQELQALVEDFVRDEVLYREAVALGLDRDDTIVRRRLRQKMEFISEDAGAAVEPTEQDLADYLAAHADDYRVESRLSFAQVFLDPGRRGKRMDEEAASMLEALRSGRVDPATVGDALLLEPRYVDVSESDITSLFGRPFEAALHGQIVGEWFGPLRSGYGMHLVLIEARTPGREAVLAEVRAVVARDWAVRERQRLLDQQYQQLRSRYRVTVDGGSIGAGMR